MKTHRVVYHHLFSWCLILSFLFASRSAVLAQGTTTPGTDADATAAEPGSVANDDLVRGTITVTSNDSTEQLVLGEILVALLQDAGYDVANRVGSGGPGAAHDALESGEADAMVELTGAALTQVHGLPAEALPTDAKGAYELARNLDASIGLRWLEMGPFNNTWTLMVGAELLDEGLESLDDLAEYMNANDAPLTICIDNDFYSRDDGLLALQEHYGFAFQDENMLFMEFNQIYETFREGGCHVAQGRATDGRVAAWGLTHLTDSRTFFLFHNPAVVIREEVLQANPALEDLLNSFISYLDNETMSQLNARVDIGADGLFNSGDEETPAQVAQTFLQSQRLLSPPSITVASEDYTEQLIFGEILVTLLEDAGYDVVNQTGLGGARVVRSALESGEVDVLVDRTGSALAVHHGLPNAALPADPARSYELVRSLDAARGFTWLEMGTFNDAWMLLVSEDLADEGVETIDDLADYMNANGSPLTLCIENDFYSRADGILPLQEHYGFAFQDENMLFMEFDQIYETFREGGCDVAEGYATDGHVQAWDLTALEDSGNFFPFYNPAVVIRSAMLAANPELEELLNSFMPLLDADTMSELNAQVDLGDDGVAGSGDEDTPAEVAYRFLRSNRLLTPPAITVAGKETTDQLILGEMIAALLHEAGYGVVNQVGIGGSSVVRQALEAGEVDVMVEETGTALTVYHNLPSVALPDEAGRAYALARSLDADQGITWLEMGPFNNTWTLMISDVLSEEGVESLDDLADYMNANDAPLTICIDNDFYSRDDGLLALQEHYGFAFQDENMLFMELDQIYEAFREGGCDVAEGYATDGRAAAWGLTHLTDSRSFFPFYNPAVVIRAEVLDVNPELETVLNGFLRELDDETMSALNARVDIGADGIFASGDEEAPAEVALSFLQQQGLISPTSQEESQEQTASTGSLPSE